MTVWDKSRRHPAWASMTLAALLVMAGTGIVAVRNTGEDRPPTGAPAAPAAQPTPTSTTSTPSPEGQSVNGVAYGPLPVQQLDIRYPVSGTGPFPVVVYAHSGAWTGGSRAVVPGQIAQLTDVGLAVISIDYRTTSYTVAGGFTNAFPAAQEDLDRAIRFVRANAARYAFDPQTVLVAGDSAGGHMALVAGAAPGRFADPSLSAAERAVSPVVQGVIDYAGPSDLATFARSGTWATSIVTTYLGCPAADDASTCDPTLLTDAKLATHLDAQLPPAYLAYGQLDALVSPATQGRPLADGWASARGEGGDPAAATGAVWYEESLDATHALDSWTGDALRLERWTRLVVDRSF